MDSGTTQFTDKSEEVQDLEDLVCQLQQELEQARQDAHRIEQDYEEFQENSRQLERELEIALEQSEKTCHEQESLINRQQLEIEKLKERSDRLQRENDAKDSEMSKCNNYITELKRKTQELEQINDDLERHLRILKTSKGETESKLNAAIERDALLEYEQEELLAMVQRLKDEKKELAQELKIREKMVPDNDKSLEHFRTIDSNKLKVEMETQTASPGSPLKIAHTGGNSRLSINIVSDLLRNIGSVESKLASGRNPVRESPHVADASLRESYRGRRMKQVGAPPNIHSYLRA